MPRSNTIIKHKAIRVRSSVTTASTRSEAIAHLKQCILALQRGASNVREYFGVQRALMRPYSNDPPYSLKNDIALSPLYDAFCFALKSYLTLQNKRSTGVSRTAERFLRKSCKEFEAWLDQACGEGQAAK